LVGGVGEASTVHVNGDSSAWPGGGELGLRVGDHYLADAVRLSGGERWLLRTGPLAAGGETERGCPSQRHQETWTVNG